MRVDESFGQTNIKLKIWSSYLHQILKKEILREVFNIFPWQRKTEENIERTM